MDSSHRWRARCGRTSSIELKLGIWGLDMISRVWVIAVAVLRCWLLREVLLGSWNQGERFDDYRVDSFVWLVRCCAWCNDRYWVQVIGAIYTTSQSLTHFFFILSNNISSTDIFYATTMPIKFFSNNPYITGSALCPPPRINPVHLRKEIARFLRNIDKLWYLAQNPIILAISL